MGRRAVSVELPGAESGCPAIHRGKRGPRLERRAGQPVGRRQERPHHPDRRIAVRDRPQRGGDTRRGGVREHAVPADPVCAVDRDRARAAVGDRAAEHQQVLHPGPAAREFLRAPCGGTGLHRVPGLLAQSGG
ncbi:hypothetical protein G6F59_016588 [Rhizopus arrhizus]|nr:hypothetical protein G6F59_016588 [Rhizopus arrhizus]